MIRQRSPQVKNRGMTLFIAMVITGTLLLISTGMVSLVTKQLILSSSARESQYAFYAADSGIECALFWDVKNPSGETAFATTSTTNITCNNQSFTVGGNGYGPPWPFTVNLPPDTYCAKVTVTKAMDGGTRIESRGYNTCDTSNPRRIERAIQATY